MSNEQIPSVKPPDAKPPKDRRISVYCTEKLHGALKRRARELNMPMSVYTELVLKKSLEVE